MSNPISEVNTIITLSYLETQKENQYFERKGLGEKDIKPTKIAEELIGMLNADGGTLAFGVTDDGEIQDLKSLDDKLDDYRKLIFDFVQPPCNIKLEEIEIDGNLIFLYHVEQDLERVFSRKDNDNVFLRVHDSNRILDRDHIKKLEYDKSIRRFEEELVHDFDTNDFDLDLLEEYKAKLNYQGELFDLLVKRHLAIKKDEFYHFKNAAILLFAQDPEKYIPTASVRYIRYEGTEALTGTSHNVVKDERFETNVPRLIDVIKKFLNVSFKDYYFLDIETGRFIKVPEYPEDAWLEAIVNALCHRSYNVQGNSVYIKHFDNRLEISNSGPLPAQVNIDNIKTERFARNPRLARVLEDMGYVRQLNEGVARIYESMEKSMLSVPEYSEKNGNVYLVLRNKVSLHSKTIQDGLMEHIEREWANFNETQRKILLYLFVNSSSTLDELVSYVQINENTVRTYLNKMIDDNMVERISTKLRDKNAKYQFKKNS
ncbi:MULTISPECIES: RNA-binding domain-containing protein [Empedobacter]|uniref:RNA-binding domain-containing protein n=1 Tax=Empedobacter TaxID=59734 RepID=UPI0025BACEEF|nr:MULTISPECIES: ATP-binding protein [unclassified Empedobacter]